MQTAAGPDSELEVLQILPLEGCAPVPRARKLATAKQTSLIFMGLRPGPVSSARSAICHLPSGICQVPSAICHLLPSVIPHRVPGILHRSPVIKLGVAQSCVAAGNPKCNPGPGPQSPESMRTSPSIAGDQTPRRATLLRLRKPKMQPRTPTAAPDGPAPDDLVREQRSRCRLQQGQTSNWKCCKYYRWRASPRPPPPSESNGASSRFALASLWGWAPTCFPHLRGASPRSAAAT